MSKKKNIHSIVPKSAEKKKPVSIRVVKYFLSLEMLIPIYINESTLLHNIYSIK